MKASPIIVFREITSDGKRLYASSTYEGLYGGVFVSNDGGLQWSLRANEEALHGRNLAQPDSVSRECGRSICSQRGCDLEIGGRRAKPGCLCPSLACVAMRQVSALAAPDESTFTRFAPFLDSTKGKLVLFAGTDAGLFRSSNSGTTWEQVKAAGITGVSVLAIYAPPSGASRLAVRTASGLFISEDSGRTWQPALVPNGYYIYDLALPVEHESRNSCCNFARHFAVY